MPSTYEPIATTTLTSATNTVTFSSIPAAYTDLQMIAYFGDSSSGGDSRMYFNGDTGNTYSMNRWWSNYNGTAIEGQILLSTAGNNGFWLSQNNANSSDFICSKIDINNYASSSMFKQAIIQNYQSGSTRAQTPTTLSGAWKNTAAVTSITLVCSAGNFPVNTCFTIYGILKA